MYPIESAIQSDERAQFIVKENDDTVYVFQETGDQAVRPDTGIVKRIPLHATAVGKAILAPLPKKQVKEIIDERRLDLVATNTIGTKETLYEELEQIRQEGFNINNGESTEGVRQSACR